MTGPQAVPDVPIAAFVDGFNLYYGLRALGDESTPPPRRDLWLDIERLLTRYTRPSLGERLDVVHYFTAEVHGEGWIRQNHYLRALEHGSRDLRAHVGRFQQKKTTCRKCGARWTTYEEKESDVALAAYLVDAAISAVHQQLWIVSGDADMVPGVRIAKTMTDAEIVVVRPPRRQSYHLEQLADRVLHIRDADPRRHQFPDQVATPGLVVNRPAHWH